MYDNGRFDGNMIGKENAGRIYGACLATMWATLIATLLNESLHALSRRAVGVIFVALWMGFYLTGVWATGERKHELDKKFPLSSRVLRERKKELYDWLGSRGKR